MYDGLCHHQWNKVMKNVGIELGEITIEGRSTCVEAVRATGKKKKRGREGPGPKGGCRRRREMISNKKYKIIMELECANVLHDERYYTFFFVCFRPTCIWKCKL